VRARSILRDGSIAFREFSRQLALRQMVAPDGCQRTNQIAVVTAEDRLLTSSVTRIGNHIGSEVYISSLLGKLKYADCQLPAVVLGGLGGT
jgi:hypothetical protein